MVIAALRLRIILVPFDHRAEFLASAGEGDVDGSETLGGMGVTDAEDAEEQVLRADVAMAESLDSRMALSMILLLAPSWGSWVEGAEGSDNAVPIVIPEAR